MTAKILIIDDIKSNIDLIRQILSNSYYELIEACNGLDGLKAAKELCPDLILLDIMMPDIDGFEVCKRIKQDESIVHIPIIMITALNDIASKTKGLEVGADDFLSKPFNHDLFHYRVKFLLRLKEMSDIVRLKLNVDTQMLHTLEQDTFEIIKSDTRNSKILIIDDDLYNASSIKNDLVSYFVNIEILYKIDDENNIINKIILNDYDSIILNVHMIAIDPMILASRLKGVKQDKYLSIIASVDELSDLKYVISDLNNIGIDDLVLFPHDSNELIIRCRNNIRRKLYQDFLYYNVKNKVENAVIDGKTGLYNSTYFEIYLKNLLQSSALHSKMHALIMIDNDDFKNINDEYGHACGDQVLIMIANLIHNKIKIGDIGVRFGGDEFVIILINYKLDEALKFAKTLQDSINTSYVEAGDAYKTKIKFSVSMGLTAFPDDENESSAIFKRADDNLYYAKNNGKNNIGYNDGTTKILLEK
ncbi:MAG: diguanylate cyclase [Anaplasmataceae bacterium]|nr:diguanylate cyclase [Anaplasmataceae bacterium]